MATIINFALFFFTLLYALLLLPAYQARLLNGGYLYVRFDLRPPLQAAEVIQMVAGKEDELQSPPQPSSYGRDNPKSPPSPKVAPPREEATYGRVKPKPPPSPRVAPSHGEKTYGGDNPKLAPPEAAEITRNNTETPPSPEVAPPEGDNTYGRGKRKSPPSPEVAPSRGQLTYGGEKVELKMMPFPNPDQSDSRSGYGRVDPVEPTRQNPMSQLARW